jgi:D-xylose transport system permease protein
VALFLRGAVSIFASSADGHDRYAPCCERAAKPRRAFSPLEIDTRLLGMIGAFVLICLVFNCLTEGRFMTPRNIFNLTIQTVSVAIMATGMVFVIVTRHIDLSVGSLLATCSAVMAMVQTVVVPQWLGTGLEHWLIAPVAILIGLAAGAIIGAFQGWLDRLSGDSRLHRHAGRAFSFGATWPGT